jgi:hypothetical protein
MTEFDMTRAPDTPDGPVPWDLRRVVHLHRRPPSRREPMRRISLRVTARGASCSSLTTYLVILYQRRKAQAANTSLVPPIVASVQNARQESWVPCFRSRPPAGCCSGTTKGCESMQGWPSRPAGPRKHGTQLSPGALLRRDSVAQIVSARSLSPVNRPRPRDSPAARGGLPQGKWSRG